MDDEATKEAEAQVTDVIGPWRRIAELEARLASMRADRDVFAGMARSNGVFARRLAMELVKLKRDGFAPPVVLPAVERDRDPLGPLTRNAIAERAGGDAELYRSMEHAAQTMATVGKQPDELIAAAIWRGGTLDDED
ncbi:MAG: hypothetical protein ACREMQ_08970 [Longimicrobiales bacterium]